MQAMMLRLATVCSGGSGTRCMPSGQFAVVANASAQSLFIAARRPREN